MLRCACTFTLIAAVLSTTQAWGSWEKYKCSKQPQLVCHFQEIGRSGISGTAYLTPVFKPGRWTRRGRRHGRCMTEIKATIRGLTRSRQGWHIHEFGDVTDSKGLATGGHYENPFDKNTMPGLPGDRNRHWGDIGNLVSNRRGVARYHRIDRVIRYTSAVAGRGMIIHAMRDFGREPNRPGSGARIAQCVIGIRKSR